MNTEKNNSIQQQQNCLIDQEENLSNQMNNSFLNENQFFQDIDNKFLRLKQFIQSIESSKDKKLTQQVLKYFQRQVNQFQTIDSNYVIDETTKRIQKMKKSKKIKKNWSSNDMNVLIWIICKYAEKQSLHLNQIQPIDQFWNYISSLIPGTTPQSCLFKWLSQRRYKITIHSWKQSQEKLLIYLQKKYKLIKNKWKIISQELFLKNQDQQKVFRHPKQCRQHYASFLDPKIIKGPWSKYEDISLLGYIAQKKCQKKWCRLTKILEGRTENAIKNRYQLLFAKLKKKKQNKNKQEIQIIQEFLKENDSDYEIKKLNNQASKNLISETNNSMKQLNHKTQQILQNNETLQTVQDQKFELIQNCFIKQSYNSSPVVTKVLFHASNFKFYQNLNLKNAQAMHLKQSLFTDSPLIQKINSQISFLQK